MRTAVMLLAVFLIGLASLWFAGYIGRPTLETINDLRFVSVQSNNVTIAGDAVFHNPNPFPCEVIATDLAITINNVRVGRVRQTHDTRVEGNSNFIVPVEVRFSPKKLLGEQGLLGGVMALFSEQTMDVQYKGTITVRFWNVHEVKVDVADSETLNVSFN